MGRRYTRSAKNSPRLRAGVDDGRSTPSDHVVRACAEQLCDTGVQFIPVAFHEPVCVILDSVIVVVDGEVLEPRVGFQVLLVGDLARMRHADQITQGRTHACTHVSDGS